jgi:hypothetical protein
MQRQVYSRPFRFARRDDTFSPSVEFSHYSVLSMDAWRRKYRRWRVHNQNLHLQNRKVSVVDKRGFPYNRAVCEYKGLFYEYKLSV